MQNDINRKNKIYIPVKFFYYYLLDSGILLLEIILFEALSSIKRGYLFQKNSNLDSSRCEELTSSARLKCH